MFRFNPDPFSSPEALTGPNILTSARELATLMHGEVACSVTISEASKRIYTVSSLWVLFVSLIRSRFSGWKMLLEGVGSETNRNGANAVFVLQMSQ